jgi:hypothetical protein
MTAGSLEAGDVFGTGLSSKDAAKKVGASGRLAEHKPPASSVYYPQVPIGSPKIDDLSLVAIVSGQQGNSAEPDPKLPGGRKNFLDVLIQRAKGPGVSNPKIELGIASYPRVAAP